MHQFECVHRVPWLECICFDSRHQETLVTGGCQGHHGKSVKWGSEALDRFVWRSKCRNEVEFVNVEGFEDGSGQRQVTIMYGIESPAKDGYLHDPAASI